MPKQAGSTAARNPVGAGRDEFDDFERDQWKRPLIPPVGKSGREHVKGRRDGYTRASTLGGVLEDQYGLGQWRMRQVAFGMSRSRAQYAAAQALPSNEGKANRDALGKIADACLEAAESGAAALIGTATHSLTEIVDRGEEIPRHLDGGTREALAAYVELTQALEVLAIEAKVVCDEHRVAGTFDRLYRLRGTMVTPDGERLQPGTIVAGDLKTSGTADYFGIKFAVQLAEYAHGVPFDLATYGRASWEQLIGIDDPRGVNLTRPHAKWALIVHVPTGNPAGAGLYWVDLEAGAELSALAVLVKVQRGRKDLVVQASPPSLPDVLTRAALLAEIDVAVDRARIDALWKSHRTVWGDEHTARAGARLDALGIPRRVTAGVS